MTFQVIFFFHTQECPKLVQGPKQQKTSQEGTLLEHENISGKHH